MEFSEQNFRIQEMYEKSLLQKQELKNVVDTAVETAIEKNIIKIAKKMLQEKFDINSISKVTSLSIEEIEEIAKNTKL